MDYGKSRTIEIFENFVSYCSDTQFIAIAGKNRKMKLAFEEIANKYNESNNIVVFSYTNRVPEFMSISHLVVTKPGGLTTTESMASHLPMIIINPIPGQEEENAEFLEKNGVAVWIQKNDNVKNLLENLFSDPEKLENMKENTKKLAKINSTKNICDILLKQFEQI